MKEYGTYENASDPSEKSTLPAMPSHALNGSPMDEPWQAAGLVSTVVIRTKPVGVLAAKSLWIGLQVFATDEYLR